MEQKDLLLSRMDDLAAKAVKVGCVASRFLTPAEARGVTEYFKNKSYVRMSVDGGFENAERVRAVFLNPDWGVYERDKTLSAIQIAHRPQDKLGHRDVLGAIMALGIERDTIGDIICKENYKTLICLPELEAYIVENLKKAGRVGVTVTQINLDTLPEKQEEVTIKTDTVASLRLDALLCAAFDLPRAKAAELIASGKVNVDHIQALNPSKELAEGTLLSVRGMGRAKVTQVGGLSKKGRIFVSIGVFGK